MNVPIDLSLGVNGRLPQVYLTPGTLYCSSGPAVVSTVLGSCVSVCLVDRYNRAAGINHFVLPYNPDEKDSLRYGDVALDRLLERMSHLGCASGTLRAKVFGGAAVLPFGEAQETVGTKNVRVAIEWLRNHSIPIVARWIGGTSGLSIRFYTGSGSVLVRRIASGIDVDISRAIPNNTFCNDIGFDEKA
ncbi:MAG: chemotaxis protein CheD [Acetobacteraceae bacterium]|nr:chemotaxis protein CheD [Acetobacteraceae bacterium]